MEVFAAVLTFIAVVALAHIAAIVSTIAIAIVVWLVVSTASCVFKRRDIS